MKELTLGMIGLDTSHCPTIAKLLNHKKSSSKIRYGWSGGNPSFSQSIQRVEKYTKELNQKYSIQIMNNIEDFGHLCDAFLLTSVDGRQHLNQFEILSQYQKPVWIDKPFTCSLSDAKKIVNIAEETNTPIYSCSSLRFYKGIAGIHKNQKIHIAEVHGKVPILEDYPGYFWYGVHSAEILYNILGVGCQKISVTSYPNVDIVQASWKDGRIGLLFGYRYDELSQWGVRLFTDNRMIESNGLNKPSGFSLMIPSILEFFHTKKTPISHEEMIEVVAFLESIDKARISKNEIIIET